jgi:prepilin-type N-terminal cleavage/methylation domain-containing protein
LKNDEGGLTLVEVLATLTILSIVSVIIYSVFFQGLTFSNKAITKNQMHQETNFIINDLKRIHTTARRYDIINTNSDCDITINLKDDPTNANLITDKEVFSHPTMCFTLEVTNSVSNPVVPNRDDNDVSIKLTTSDKDKPENKITINTFLYRVKGADYN